MKLRDPHQALQHHAYSFMCSTALALGIGIANNSWKAGYAAFFIVLAILTGIIWIARS
jgi:hypothetical protein